jgi:hypothetical protein
VAGDTLVYTLLGINKLSRPTNEAGEDIDRLAGKLDSFGKAGAKSLSLLTAAGVGSGVAIGGAVGGLAALFAVITGMLVMQNQVVREQFGDLGEQVSQQLTSAAAPVVPFYQQVATELGRTASQLDPLLNRAFAASGPHVLTLTRSVQLFALNAMPGFVRSVERAGPALLGWQGMLAATGNGLGDFFDEISLGASDSQTVLTGFGEILRIVLPAVGALLTQLAGVAADHMDQLVVAVANVVGIVTMLSGGALPALSGALTVALNVLDGLMQLLGPWSGLIGAGAVAVWGLNAALRGIGAVTGIVSTVDAAISGVVTKLKGGGDNAVSFGKRVGGLVGMLGGPLGLVIGAVTIGLGLLGAAQASTAEKTAAHTAYVDALTESLRESNGVIDANARSTTARNEDVKDAINSAKQFGVSQSQVVDAVLGQGRALDELRPKLQSIIDANKEYATNEVTGELEWTGAYVGQGQAAAELLAKINGLNQGTQEARQATDDYGASMQSTSRSMRETTNAGAAIASAIEVLRDTTRDAESRMRALKDIMDALAGEQLSAADAEAKFNAQLIDLRELAGDGTDRLQGWGDALVDVNGKIDTLLPNGQSLYSTLRSLRDSAVESAQATYDLAIAQGDTMPAAAAKAAAVIQAARDEVLKTAQAMGIGEERANALADQMGLIPDRVVTAIDTPNMGETQQELLILKARVDQIPGQKSVTVTSLSEGARLKLVELGYTVTTLPNGTVRIESNTDPAWSKLNEFTQTRSTKYVDVVTVSRGYGGGMQVNYHGNILRFATGGMLGRLTPFAGGIADVFGPNTWRITGDRPDVPESYIPWVANARSLSILDTTARALGRQVVPLGGGGQVTPVFMPGGGTSMSVVINVSGADSPTRTAQEIRRALLELRRDLGGAPLSL